MDNKNRRKKEEKTTTDSERQCPGMEYKYKLGLQLSPWIDIHKKTPVKKYVKFNLVIKNYEFVHFYHNYNKIVISY